MSFQLFNATIDVGQQSEDSTSLFIVFNIEPKMVNIFPIYILST